MRRLAVLGLAVAVASPASAACKAARAAPGQEALQRAFAMLVEKLGFFGGRLEADVETAGARVVVAHVEREDDQDDAKDDEDEKETADDDDDSDAIIHVRNGHHAVVHVPRPTIPPVPPTPPVAPIPPIPPMPPFAPISPHQLKELKKLRNFKFDKNAFSFHFSTGEDEETVSEHQQKAPALEVLSRIAQAGGWALTVVGLGQDAIDLSIDNASPRDAAKAALKASRSWGVLRRDPHGGPTLYVLPARGGVQAGDLLERKGKPSRKGRKHGKVQVMQGDLVVPAGTVLDGDAVAVGGSIAIEPGAMVQGDAVAVGGSVEVKSGAVVEGDAVAVFGGLDVDADGVVLGDGVGVLGGVEADPGAHVLGDHVQIGLGKLLGGFGRRGSGHWYDRLGALGFFPTLALFALVYLLGLLTLATSPNRLRGVGTAFLASPIRNFFVGMLCWLMVLPLGLLLVVSLVGILLLPLLPFAIFIGIGLGLSSLALRVGEVLPAGEGKRFVPAAALGMGTLVLLLIAFVPWLGFPLLVLGQFIALGATVGSRMGRAPRLPA